MKLGTIYPLTSPRDWKPAFLPDLAPGEKPEPTREPDGIELKFENYKPGAPLEFTYYLVGFPQVAADCDAWVRQVRAKRCDKSRRARACEKLWPPFWRCATHAVRSPSCRTPSMVRSAQQGQRIPIERAQEGRPRTPRQNCRCTVECSRQNGCGDAFNAGRGDRIAKQPRRACRSSDRSCHQPGWQDAGVGKLRPNARSLGTGYR